MTGQETITRFNLQVDDASELSDTEALALANQIYLDICNRRPWEWLKRNTTGTQATDVPYVDLPANFKQMAPLQDNKTVVLVGSLYTPYTVVPYAKRFDYVNTDGYCYVDTVNARLYFCKQPTIADTYTFDYICIPDALTDDTSPLFRDDYGVIAYGMAEAFNPIEQTNKTESYQRENATTYEKYLEDMAVEDAELKLVCV